jgi:O-antigen/teichoic acid export membrane protein
VIQVVVNPIWTMFPNVAASLWNQGDRGEVQRLFESTAGAMLVLVLPVIAGGAVLGEGLLRALAPSDFASAAPVLPLVLAGYLCFMLAAFYETVFGLIDRQGLGALTVVIACAVNIGLNVVLIPPFSYIGAAVATVAAFALQLGICLLLSARLGTLRTPLRTPTRIVIAALGMAGLLIPLRHIFVTNGPLGVLAGVVVGAVIYAALCVLLGVLRPAAVLSEFRRALRRRAVGAAST